jgi:hypothetical protein
MFINIKHAALIPIISMISCSTIPENIGSGQRSVYKAISTAVFGSEINIVTKELVNNIPYASMKLQIGKGPTGLVILESIDKDITTWVSADGVYLQLKNGRIQAAQGLINNLSDYRSSELSFKEIIGNELNEISYRYISLDNPPVLDMKIKVQTSIKGVQSIDLISSQRDLILVEEEISNDFIRWKFTNQYWVDPDDGFVWKSNQQFAPNLPVFLYEITRRPKK